MKDQSTLRQFAGALLSAIILGVIALGCAVAKEKKPIVAPAMVGNGWKGDAKIIVQWCKQKKLPVSLDIAADGTVTGKIGDAKLVDGRLKKNRGAVGRKLNVKTDYVITGKLKGDIVAAEGIRRASVKIPLNFSSGKCTGGIHTSGTKAGGKKSMILSASDLTLVKVQAKAGKERRK